MQVEGKTLKGWPAVGMFLMLAVTPVLTALVASFPIEWLVDKIFSSAFIHTIFGVGRLGYWRVVGLFAIWFATRFKIKIHGPQK